MGRRHIQSDVFLDSRRGLQELSEKFANLNVLGSVVLGDYPGMEVLPETTTMAFPPFSVRHKAEDVIHTHTV